VLWTGVICGREIPFILKFQSTLKQWGSGFDRLFAGARAPNTFSDADISGVLRLGK
jgi:hypothetical protein